MQRLSKNMSDSLLKNAKPHVVLEKVHAEKNAGSKHDDPLASEEERRLLLHALREARTRRALERNASHANIERERTRMRAELERQREHFRATVAQERERAEWAMERERMIRQSMTMTEETMAQVRRSRSWRWSAWIRGLEWMAGEIPYVIFATLRMVWAGLGFPLPGTVRRVRHGLLGKYWPADMRLPPAKVPGPVGALPDPLSTLLLAGRQPLRVPTEENPDVSIIIPVCNHFEYTYACIASITANTVARRYEVIVVDDASTDETREILANAEGIRVVRNDENRGFVDSCNEGAAVARGTYLVFLNNDTLVTYQWLDALIHTFELQKNVGLVGPRFLYPDGTLQEAGGLIWRDGNGWNYGRGDDPQKPEYRMLRDTDYCSGACIAIPRELFLEIGRFDAAFSPGYYEDTDLAFKVRQAGYRVLYQPFCTVLHFSGVSAGTDPAQGMKRHQETHREVFRLKWAETLETYPETGGEIERGVTHRILVIDAALPRPSHDSGSLRMASLLGLLKEPRTAVTFLPMNLARVEPHAEHLERRGIRVLTHPHVSSVESHLRKEGHRYDIVMLSRLTVASAYLDAVRVLAPHAKILYDTVDLHFLREEREAHIHQEPKLLKRAKRHKKQELDLAMRADAVIVVSDEEKRRLEAECPQARTFVVSNIHELRPPKKAFHERNGILFLGSFRHPPNVDGIRWFARAVFPLMQKEIPDCVLTVIGENPPKELEQLDNPGIRILGHMPNLSAHLEECRLSVAPLRFGAGVKGKINMSMSAGLPVVATHVAAEGMHLRPGDNVLLADSAQDFAAAALRLYGDRELWSRLSQASIQNITEHFSPARAREALEEIWRSLIPALASTPEKKTPLFAPPLVRAKNARPLLCFFGHHKCASSWMSKIFYAVSRRLDLRCHTIKNEKILTGTLEEAARDAQADVVCYLNADYTYVEQLKYFRAVHLIRDPRDLVVSAYFSHLYTHPTAEWPALVKHRQALQECSKEEGIFLEMQFCNWVFRSLRNWNYCHPDILELQLRNFTTVPTSFFIDAFTHLGLLSDQPCPSPYRGPQLSTVELLKIIEANDFASLTGGRAPGQEDLRSHYRKGVVGDWKNHLTHAHVDRFKELHGDLLMRLAFEPDDAWSLPASAPASVALPA